MIIGLDFDGVIAKSNKLKREIARRRHGIDIRATYFSRAYVVRQQGLLTDEQYDAILNDVYTNPEHIKKIEFIDGALEHIKNLIEEEIRIVTSRRAENDIAGRILEQQGLNLGIRYVGPGATKIEACKGCFVFVDDDLEKLIPLREVVPHRFLLTHEYNLSDKPRDFGVERANGWLHLYREIREIKVE